MEGLSERGEKGGEKGTWGEERGGASRTKQAKPAAVVQKKVKALTLRKKKKVHR